MIVKMIFFHFKKFRDKPTKFGTNFFSCSSISYPVFILEITTIYTIKTFFKETIYRAMLLNIRKSQSMRNDTLSRFQKGFLY